MPTSRVMIDIETLSREPEAAVLAIAAKTFDGSESLSLTIDNPSGHIEPETVRWWMHRPDAARKTVMPADGSALRELDAVIELAAWIHSRAADRDIELWSRSPSFDLVILGRLFARNGVEFPIPFWHWRDVRTIHPGRIQAEVPHDPMSDVDAQIAAVLGMMEKGDGNAG